MIELAALVSLLLAPVARAQPAPPASQPVAPFQSSGVRATIVSATVTRNGQVSLQMLLQNVTDKDVDLLSIRFTDASSANGASYRLSKVSGLTSCGFVSGPQDEKNQLLRCLSDANHGDYTRMAPNTPLVTLLTFSKTSREAAEGSISFNLRFLARASQGSNDVLQDQADDSTRQGTPHVVVISFPLIPLSPR